MENASKALIIAGAILLSIVIISLGLVVVNNVRDTIDNTNMNAQEIEAFNGKFTPYVGDKVSGSKVKALIATISSSNADSYQKDTAAGYTTDTEAEEPYVSVVHYKSDGTTEETKVEAKLSTLATEVEYPTVNSSRYYKVEVSMTKGRVSKVTITNLID